MVCFYSISDLGAEWDIHPKNKRDVGIRLARLTLKHLYGADLEADPPQCRKALRQGNQVTLCFENAAQGLFILGDEVSALSVTMADLDVSFTCTVEGNKLMILLQDSCSGPVQICFAQTNWYQVNLFNSAMLPAVPFRLNC